MVQEGGRLFSRLAALADPLRGRILLTLEHHELTVSELCSVFQLAQSTMSRHLKALADEGWLTYRAEGTSRRYSLPIGSLAPESRRVWEVLRGEVVAIPGAAQDAERIRAVLSERRAERQEFFSAAAGEWDRLRGEIVGRRLDAVALLGLLDDRWRVGDLGCGTGQVAEVLAPFVSSIVAIDDSPEMLAAADARLGRFATVEVRYGALEELPLQDGELDAAVVFLVLAYIGDPVVPVREAARVVRPGGRLLVIDLTPHHREEYRQRLGHLALGFAEEEVRTWMAQAGLEGFRYSVLPADREAKGPALFAATARVPTEHSNREAT